jgi:hypothetical protein
MIETLPAATDAMDAMSTLGHGIRIVAQSDSPVTEVIAVLIPIVAIVLGIGIGMLSLYLDYRKKREFFELHHKERMAAIEKGMEVPPLPVEFFQDPRRRQRTPGDYLRRGLVWLLVGGALTVALPKTGSHNNLWGLVPAAVGLAYLIYYFFEGQRARPPDDSRKPDRTA